MLLVYHVDCRTSRTPMGDTLVTAHLASALLTAHILGDL
jgi:hypothetical protein